MYHLLTGYISETMKLGALGIPPYRTFVLDELKEATNNFNASNIIGEGSNGQVPLYSSDVPLLLLSYASLLAYIRWLLP